MSYFLLGRVAMTTTPFIPVVFVISSITLKPIFYCDAKTRALVPRAGQYPQRECFALGIPKCWYLKTPKFALPRTQTPNANRWNIGCVGSPGVGSSRWACTFHVVNVNFIRVGYPTQTHF